MGIALFLAIGTVGTVLTRGAFKVSDEVAQPHHIGETRMSKRVPLPGTRDEIGRLICTLNEILARLDQSFEASAASPR